MAGIRREQIVDARSAARFHAQEPEPRPGLRGGHIPGSKNIHYQRLLNEIVPDFVHVLAEGRIVKSGGKELALELEAEGYADLYDEQEAVGSV